MEFLNATLILETFTMLTTLQDITTDEEFSNVSLMHEKTTLFPNLIDTITQKRVPKPAAKGNPCGDFSSSLKSIHNLSIVVYSAAFLLGVIGNGFVIWITGFKMKKTINTMWFLNLAIADFIFTFFLPITIAHTALDGHWPFGKFMCKFVSFISMLNMFASVFFLTIISLDRCVIVIFPVWAQNHRNIRLAAIVTVVTWSLALILSSPSLAFRDTHFNNKTKVISCFNNYAFSLDTRDRNIQYLRLMRHKAVILTRFFAGFVFPFFIIVVCNGIIISMLKKKRLVARCKKPFRLTVTIVITFFICWIPYHIFSILELLLHGKNCPLYNAVLIGTRLAVSLAFINSCVNPILYVIIGRNEQYRIRKSIRAVIERAFMEEESKVTRSSRFQSKSVSETTSNLL